MRSTVVAALLVTGCATMSEVNGGPIVGLPTNDDASVGGAFAAHGAVGSSNEKGRTLVGLDVNAKAKLAGSSQQIAFGQGLLYTGSIGKTGEGILRTGLHLAFERFDEKLLVGGGPYATLMGGFTLDEDVVYVPERGIFGPYWRRERTIFTFGPIAEIDARFSRPSAIAFVGLGFGIAWASATIAPPRP
jgi:hypothetical protein